MDIRNMDKKVEELQTETGVQTHECSSSDMDMLSVQADGRYCPNCGTKTAKEIRHAYLEAGDYDPTGCAQEYDDQRRAIEYQCISCQASFYQ